VARVAGDTGILCQGFRGNSDNRKRGNGLKQKEGKFGLGIRKKFLTVRVEKHWHRLPREWEVPHPWKHSRLDGALSTLMQLKMSGLIAGGVGLEDL